MLLVTRNTSPDLLIVRVYLQVWFSIYVPCGAWAGNFGEHDGRPVCLGLASKVQSTVDFVSVIL